MKELQRQIICTEGSLEGINPLELMKKIYDDSNIKETFYES